MEEKTQYQRAYIPGEEDEIYAEMERLAELEKSRPKEISSTIKDTAIKANMILGGIIIVIIAIVLLFLK